MSEVEYTHTVHCYDDKTLREHFTSKPAAARYANKLLRQGHKARIFPYRPQRTYGDLLAEEGPPPGVKVE